MSDFAFRFFNRPKYGSAFLEYAALDSLSGPVSVEALCSQSVAASGSMTEGVRRGGWTPHPLRHGPQCYGRSCVSPTRTKRGAPIASPDVFRVGGLVVRLIVSKTRDAKLKAVWLSFAPLGSTLVAFAGCNPPCSPGNMIMNKLFMIMFPGEQGAHRHTWGPLMQTP